MKLAAKSLPRSPGDRAIPPQRNPAEIVKKTVEFQMKEAAEGSPTFQHERDLRYLYSDANDRRTLGKQMLNGLLWNSVFSSLPQEIESLP